MKKVFIFLFFLFPFAFSEAQVIDQDKNQTTPTPPTADGEKKLQSLQSPYRALDSTQISTGILYDNIVSFTKIDSYSGARPLKPASRDLLKQVYLELSSASVSQKKFKPFSQLETSHRANEKVIPIAILNYQYNKVKDNALAKGLLQSKNGKIIPGKSTAESPYLTRRAFVAAALREKTFRGSSVTFRVNRDLYLTNLEEKITRVSIDFQDNRGLREVPLDQDIDVHYASTGTKTISVAVTTSEQGVLHSSFVFEVLALTSPGHVDLGVQADIAYQGALASGTAYIYQSPRNAQITNPIFLVEGFDLDNSRNADELYFALNQLNLADNLLQQGYDIIIINFTDATTYIQANAMVVVKFLNYFNTYLKASDKPHIVVGASMGGVVSRYALRYMETNNLPHETGLFVSFDSPQQGANIPLGDQYLIKYFAINPIAPNAGARASLSGLNTVAAQQLLVYHHISQPEATLIPLLNPHRQVLVGELAAFGYPQNCRNVAISNGSGAGHGQPFQPGSQFIRYFYESITVDIDIRSYAVPLVNQAKITHFKIDPLGFNYYEVKKDVILTAPYDNAAGSTRPTNADIANRDVEYGSIKALIANHCFIPTISSLDFKGFEPSPFEPYFAGLLRQDLFYNMLNDPEILRKTPFHAIYYPTLPTPEFPAVNQEHMAITSESVGWIMKELDLMNNPPAGKITREMWWNVPGLEVAAIPVGEPPATVDELTRLEVPANQGDDYGQRIRGYLHPAQTGLYTFWIASDNGSELYLSSDDQPANKVRIAFLNEPVAERDWYRYETQRSAPVQLETGRKYYLEVLHKDGGWEDNLAVGWRTPGAAADALPVVVPGAVLSPYISLPAGKITREMWWNVPGLEVAAIPVGEPPATVDELTRLEVPANQGDDYGERIRGYLQVNQTGLYTFWIASDNGSELYLSSDDQPANKVRIAFLNEPVAERDWYRYETQRSGALTLNAGKRYYLEVLHKEGWDLDNLAVGWQTPATGNAPPVVVPGAVLSPYLGPAANARTAIASRPAAEKVSSRFMVYPNPAAGLATLTFTAQGSGAPQLQVIDLQGRPYRPLIRKMAQAGSQYQWQLDTSHLPAGMYLLRLATGKEIHNFKLLVIH